MKEYKIVLTYRKPKAGKAPKKGEYNDGSVKGEPYRIPCDLEDGLVFESSQGYPVTVKM
jgi:hypothetical protein